ncbi:hypothetical protein D3C71_1616340 [compost metagenome]
MRNSSSTCERPFLADCCLFSRLSIHTMGYCNDLNSFFHRRHSLIFGVLCITSLSASNKAQAAGDNVASTSRDTPICSRIRGSKAGRRINSLLCAGSEITDCGNIPRRSVCFNNQSILKNDAVSMVACGGLMSFR